MFFKHAGGRINLEHVTEVVAMASMTTTLRVFFPVNPEGTFYTDISGPDADRLRLILDALELVMLAPTPVAKVKPNVAGEVWVVVHKVTRVSGQGTYISYGLANATIYRHDYYEAVQLV